MQQSRQLAAIMFTDMVGYTAMMQENEIYAIQQRDKSKRILEDALTKFNGKLLQYYGDGTLSIFSSALNAVKSAIEIQTLHLEENIKLRIGIHTGDVMFDETGIYGDSVNVASRIETMAVPGAVFISEKLFTEISNQGIEATTLGYFELKNVKQPMQVYAISNPGIMVPARDEVKGKLKETLNSIAVLPFASLSSDPENEFFCDGITEELLNVLAKLDGLQVTSRTSSFAFKGKNEDIREIGAKLNVQKVLEGSVRKAGNKVRITAQLINAADGYHLWSETYDRSLEDIFAVQDDIAREIANKFRLNLNEQEHGNALVKVATENMEAYKLYLRGIYLWNSQLLENLQPAMDSFEEATQLDPDFADPFAYIAFLHYSQGFFGISLMREALENCRKAAEKAMAIDPQHSQALLATGIVKLFHDFDWQECRHFLERSIAINPNNALAQIILASYHFLMLEKQKAIEIWQIALRIDPLGGFTNGSVADFYNTIGQPDKAISICEEILKINPGNEYILSQYYVALGLKGQWEKVIPELELARSRSGEFPLIMATLGFAYAKNNQLKKAEEIISWFVESQKQQPGLVLDQVAWIYAVLGKKDAFFELLESSISSHSINILWLYGSHYFPDDINQDQRFKAIRQRIGLPV